MTDMGLAGAFLGGLLALLSPCSVMLLPSFFAYAFTTRSQLIVRTSIFYLGLCASLIPLGVFASALGSLLTVYRHQMIVTVGIAIIIAGLLLITGITIPIPGMTSLGTRRSATSLISVFLLGSVYAVAGACAGPILGSVLLVASLGSIPYGIAIMTLYAAGMALPLLVLSWLWTLLGDKQMRWLAPRTVSLRWGKRTWVNSWTQIISGILTITVGILLLISDGSSSLRSMISLRTQSRIESSALSFASHISDIYLIAIAILVIAILGVAVWIRRSDPTSR